MRTHNRIEVGYEDLGEATGVIRYSIMNHTEVTLIVLAEKDEYTYTFENGDLKSSGGKNSTYVTSIEATLKIDDFRKHKRDITLDVSLPNWCDVDMFTKKLTDLIVRNIAPKVNLLPMGDKVEGVISKYIMHHVSNKSEVNIDKFHIQTEGYLNAYAVFNNPAGPHISVNVPPNLLPIDQYNNKTIKPILLVTNGSLEILGLYVEY